MVAERQPGAAAIAQTDNAAGSGGAASRTAAAGTTADGTSPAAGAETAPVSATAEPALPASIRDAIDYLRSIDINHMTPLDAMNTLYELKDRFKLS